MTPTDTDNRLNIPLSLEGLTSYFHSFKPTLAQYEAAVEGENLFHLMDGDLEWDPHSDSYAKQEEAMMDDDGELRLPRTSKKSRQILRMAIDQEIMFDAFANALVDNRLIANIRSTL